MHQQAYDALGQMLKRSGIGLHAQWKVLDMGGRDVNSTAQGLDTRAWLPAANWTGADITPGPGVGIVTDATARPWKHDTTFDLAVCTEMLEHVQHWPEVAANLADAVRDGQLGQVFITCAGPGRPEHDSGGLPHLPEGQWYANVEEFDLYTVLRELFREVHAEFNPGICDVYAWARQPR